MSACGGLIKPINGKISLRKIRLLRKNQLMENPLITEKLRKIRLLRKIQLMENPLITGLLRKNHLMENPLITGKPAYGKSAYYGKSA